MANENKVIRFGIGPWEGRYSSVWRIWTNRGSDDIYLAVRQLARYLKISLHQSGKFRLGFTDHYNQKLVEEGKDATLNRAFLRWEKGTIPENTIVQALDIHFPLPNLSLTKKPKTSRGKRLFLIEPDKRSLGANDTVTLKILVHKTDPKSNAFQTAVSKKGLMPFFWIELEQKEFISAVFRYSKKLPLKISEKEERGYAKLIHNYFLQLRKTVGDKIEDFTLQIVEEGRPPSIINMGGLSAHWKSEKQVVISDSI